MFASGNGDHIDIDGPDYVVSNLADSFTHADDHRALSLREAIDLANENDGVEEEIWLPAWNFVLTRDRETYATDDTDMEVGFGDLDISESLNVRGVAGSTSVAWRPGVIDAVVDLLGDYDGDGITTPDNGHVGGNDYLDWAQQTGSTGEPNDFSADGNDDGNVDGEDLTVWEEHFGNSLDIEDVLV